MIWRALATVDLFGCGMALCAASRHAAQALDRGDALGCAQHICFAAAAFFIGWAVAEALEQADSREPSP